LALRLHIVNAHYDDLLQLIDEYYTVYKKERRRAGN